MNKKIKILYGYMTGDEVTRFVQPVYQMREEQMQMPSFPQCVTDESDT